MTEQEKIAFLERLSASGANIGQINLGDGHQYFGCSVTQTSSAPSTQPKFLKVVDVIESSNVPQPSAEALYPFVVQQEKAEEVIGLLRQYMEGINSNKPKDLMMPVRAALDARVIRKPTYTEFKAAFPEFVPRAKSSFDGYLKIEKFENQHPYYGVGAFLDMVSEFKQLKKESGIG